MKIVIIGGVAAGAKVAAKAKRLSPDAQIDIFTKDTHVSYSTCGLPYYIGGAFDDWNKLIVRSPEAFEQSGIHIHLQHLVTKILTEDKAIIVSNLLTKETMQVSYDKLVIATGSTPEVKGYAKFKQKNIFTLKTIEDGIAIKEKSQQINNVTLLGGGYINIELMESFVKNNKQVILFEKSSSILPKLDRDFSELVQEYIIKHSNNQVKIITGDTAKELIGEDEVTHILTTNGEIFKSEMVILALGVKPIVDLAITAGIQLGKTGAIKVNSRMETNIKDIYACGDCAEKFHIISKTPVWFPLGSTANKEGRITAINICGGHEDFEGVIGAAVTRYFDLNISKTGFSEWEAKEFGFNPVSATVTKKDKAGYMPDVHNVTLKLTADMHSHKIIGAQAIGCGEANKKIDAISIGIENGVSLHELLNIDLTYSPPLASSVDIIHATARKLYEKIFK